jgi:putative DNA primase/helicase
MTARDSIAAAMKAAAPPEPLIPFEWAADMREDDGGLREIVQDTITAGGMSVMYGESNSGKSYLAAHLAFCMARGVPWLGKQLERGAVLYVAGEGAASIRRRVRAHEKHHGSKVGPFGLIPTSLSLLSGSGDVEALIDLIRSAQSEIGEPVLLVIVDTLARAMAGANENAGEDMSRLVQAGDRIREETGAHLMWVHHSGKDQAKGARGHSSLRAALDTEMEVTADEGSALHTIHITKQRDLDSKGQRLCGRFLPVAMGESQWGKLVTACAVEDAEAPVPKAKAVRLGETQQAVIAVLAGAGKNLRMREIVEKLAPQGLTRVSLYGAVKRLQNLEMVEVSSGIVHLIKL